MYTYTCEKCGETMTSKNPANRNVFPTDQMASIMTNITNVMTRTQKNGNRMVTIEFPYTDTDKERTNDQLEMACVKIIRELSDDTVLHWLCNHKWRKDNAKKST